MAMFSLAAIRKKSFAAKFKSLLTSQNFNHTVARDEHLPELKAHMGPGEIKISKWRKLDSRKFGINQLMIPQSPWIVLRVLQNAGFEAYFVGGCVRDLLLNRIPKDFDVITTAALRQIKKKFHRSTIVGRRFPICQVNVKGCIVEVSSFDTVAEHHRVKENFPISRPPKDCDKKDLIRWRNSMHRDFTVNSLFYDPFANKIYDYVNALSDIMLSKLRTIIPAQLSFEEDCARILRGLRLAARLDLSFSEETESSIHKLSSSILSLSKDRIMMELNYMLSYGAAEPSLSLLHRFHLLEELLPVQAAHLTEHSRAKTDQSPSMLMKLFSNLDRLVSCDRPAHGSLWVAMLAFHLALVSDPQEALVVLTFGSVLYHGKWTEGVKFARGHAREVHSYLPEISNYTDSFSDAELAEKLMKLAGQVEKSVRIFTERDILLEEMEKFPESSISGLVFVPRRIMAIAGSIFEVLVADLTFLETSRESLEINYESLKNGNLRELRFVLGKIIVHTMGVGTGGVLIPDEKLDFHALEHRKRSDEFAEYHHAVDGRKCDLLNKSDRKRTTLCEEESMTAKKHKLSPKNSNSLDQGRARNQKSAANTRPMDIAEKKQDSMNDSGCLEVTSNHKKAISEKIGCVLQGYASKMQKRTDSHQVSRDEIQPLLETLKFHGKEQKPVSDKESKHGAEKKHLKLMARVSDDTSKKPQKSAEAKTLLLQNSDTTVKRKAAVAHIKGDTDIQKNEGANKLANAKQKGRLTKLSSIFK